MTIMRVFDSGAFSRALVGAGLLVLASAATQAREFQLLAGANGNSDGGGYGYVGAVIPYGQSLSKDGFLLRLWGDYVSFDYDTTLPGSPLVRTVEGDGPGLEAAIGYQFHGANSRVSAYLGARYRNFSLDPTDPGSSVDDRHWGVKGQLEVVTEFGSNFDAQVIGSYTAGLEDYFLRLRPGLTTQAFHVGPELTVLGGRQWDKQRAGLFVDGVEAFGGLNLGFSGGAENDARDNETHLYFGVDISRRF